MAKGIEIGIASETKAFKQGVDSGIIDPLDDAIDKLDDLGKNRGPDKLEDGFQDAQTASEKLKRETKETADTIEREFRQSYSSMKQSSDKATRGASESMKEIKGEALQNASETFSSFDGSVESFADGVQGTFGGIISSLGPIGAAAGAAGAAGIGLIVSALTTAQENSDELKQKAAELGAQFIDSGHKGKRSFDDVLADIKDLATETDDSKTSLKDLRDIAKTLDKPFRDVVSAYLRGGKPLQDLIDKTHKLDKANEKLGSTQPFERPTRGALKHEELLNKITDTLTTQQDAIKKAQKAQLDYLNAGATDFEVKVGLIKQVNDAYDDSAGAVEDYLNKETGLFDPSAYITAMQEREKALRDYQDTLASSDLSPEAKKFIEDQGAESAAKFLAGYKKASPAQKSELNRIWSAAGKENSGAYTDELEKGIPDKIDGPTVTPKVTAPDDAALNRWLRKPIRKSVLLDVRNRSGQRVL